MAGHQVKFFLLFALFGISSIESMAQDAIDCGDSQSCADYLLITADVMRQPVNVVSDPKQNRLPLPAFDGSGFLRTIPGFNLTRKGGAGSDPAFRGQAGSRLSIIDDGQHVYGACGGRMDPPTNYIYPETYDQITVIKGPQTVKYGPVGSAGTVLFQQNKQHLFVSGVDGRLSTTSGSFARFDAIAALKLGSEQWYANLDWNTSRSDDYHDGTGQAIASSYARHHYSTALGWAPTVNTVVELAYSESGGEAHYADRSNQARQIDHQDFALLLQQEFEAPWLQSMDIKLFRNQNDHIMDSFSLKDTIKGKGTSGNNVRRTTEGGHVWLDLNVDDDIDFTLGLDTVWSDQEGRNLALKSCCARQQESLSLEMLLAQPFQRDVRYVNYSAFMESVHHFDRPQKRRLLTGIRYDHWDVTRYSSQGSLALGREENLLSGYLRYEAQLLAHQYYVGVGRAERMPDFWEIKKADAAGMPESAFTLAPEATSQLDLGWIYSGSHDIAISLFYAQINDYILVTKTGARNIDARLYGGEASIDYAFNQQWSSQITLSYTHGNNVSDKLALGQISPLESRLTVNYQFSHMTVSALWRLVAAQNRYSLGQGNIVGQDLGPSSGFGTLALNATWSYQDDVSFILGVENVFNRIYTEHVNKKRFEVLTADSVNGSVQRVNEPGVNIWAKLVYKF